MCEGFVKVSGMITGVTPQLCDCVPGLAGGLSAKIKASAVLLCKVGHQRKIPSMCILRSKCEIKMTPYLHGQEKK